MAQRLSAPGLGEFLRARRASRSPAAAGLTRVGPRRVPGLRREELAMLAGVSVDYYTRLEQGRGGNASASVLNALADALGLNPVERRHLFDLARPPALQSRTLPPERVRASVLDLLDALELTPGMVLGRHLDVLAMNRLARGLLGDLMALPRHERNLTRAMFLNDDLAARYADWELAARHHVGMLARSVAQHPQDRRIMEMIGELSVASPQFAQWWARHEVTEKQFGVKSFVHPQVGRFEINFENLQVPATAGQTITLYIPAAGSRAEQAMRLLDSLCPPTPASARAAADLATPQLDAASEGCARQ